MQQLSDGAPLIKPSRLLAAYFASCAVSTVLVARFAYLVKLMRKRS